MDKHAHKSYRPRIRAALKRKVWENEIGDETAHGKCPCCQIALISIWTFEVGHRIAYANGGSIEESNLRPICGSCNQNMSSTNWDDFVRFFIQQPRMPPRIRPALKRQVWENEFGDETACGECPCCQVAVISIWTFQVGHRIAHANGGSIDESNLRPICGTCNQSMSSTNWDEFVKFFKQRPRMPAKSNPSHRSERKDTAKRTDTHCVNDQSPIDDSSPCSICSTLCFTKCPHCHVAPYCDNECIQSGWRLHKYACRLAFGSMPAHPTLVAVGQENIEMRASICAIIQRSVGEDVSFCMVCGEVMQLWRVGDFVMCADCAPLKSRARK